MVLGLALSGGSVRGMSHIGALRALEEEGLKPDMIAGTSAGSIVASLYATGMTVDQIEKNVFRFALCSIDIDLLGILEGMLNLGPLFKGRPVLDGLIKGRRIERIMYKLTGAKKMYQTKIPLAITATDVSDGTLVVFVSKKLHSYSKDIIFWDNALISEAVRASIAIPFIFKPKVMNIHGRRVRLVDGGVVNNLPVDILRMMGATKIIGINLGYSGDRQKGIDNIFEIGNQSIDIMSYQITKLRNKLEDVVELVFKGKPYFLTGKRRHNVVVVNPHIYDVSLFEVNRIPECIERGYRAMKDRLPEVRRLLGI